MSNMNSVGINQSIQFVVTNDKEATAKTGDAPVLNAPSAFNLSPTIGSQPDDFGVIKFSNTPLALPAGIPLQNTATKSPPNLTMPQPTPPGDVKGTASLTDIQNGLQAAIEKAQKANTPVDYYNNLLQFAEIGNQLSNGLETKTIETNQDNLGTIISLQDQIRIGQNRVFDELGKLFLDGKLPDIPADVQEKLDKLGLNKGAISYNIRQAALNQAKAKLAKGGLTAEETQKLKDFIVKEGKIDYETNNALFNDLKKEITDIKVKLLEDQAAGKPEDRKLIIKLETLEDLQKQYEGQINGFEIFIGGLGSGGSAGTSGTGATNPDLDAAKESIKQNTTIRLQVGEQQDKILGDARQKQIEAEAKKAADKAVEQNAAPVIAEVEKQNEDLGKQIADKKDQLAKLGDGPDKAEEQAKLEAELAKLQEQIQANIGKLDEAFGKAIQAINGDFNKKKQANLEQKKKNNDRIVALKKELEKPNLANSEKQKIKAEIKELEAKNKELDAQQAEQTETYIQAVNKVLEARKKELEKVNKAEIDKIKAQMAEIEKQLKELVKDFDPNSFDIANVTLEGEDRDKFLKLYGDFSSLKNQLITITDVGTQFDADARKQVNGVLEGNIQQAKDQKAQLAADQLKLGSSNSIELNENRLEGLRLDFNIALDSLRLNTPEGQAVPEAKPEYATNPGLFLADLDTAKQQYAQLVISKLDPEDAKKLADKLNTPSPEGFTEEQKYNAFIFNINTTVGNNPDIPTFDQFAGPLLTDPSLISLADLYRNAQQTLENDKRKNQGLLTLEPPKNNDVIIITGPITIVDSPNPNSVTGPSIASDKPPFGGTTNSMTTPEPLPPFTQDPNKQNALQQANANLDKWAKESGFSELAQNLGIGETTNTLLEGIGVNGLFAELDKIPVPQEVNDIISTVGIVSTSVVGKLVAPIIANPEEAAKEIVKVLIDPQYATETVVKLVNDGVKNIREGVLEIADGLKNGDRKKFERGLEKLTDGIVDLHVAKSIGQYYKNAAKGLAKAGELKPVDLGKVPLDKLPKEAVQALPPEIIKNLPKEQLELIKDKLSPEQLKQLEPTKPSEPVMTEPTKPSEPVMTEPTKPSEPATTEPAKPAPETALQVLNGFGKRIFNLFKRGVKEIPAKDIPEIDKVVRGAVEAEFKKEGFPKGIPLPNIRYIESAEGGAEYFPGAHTIVVKIPPGETKPTLKLYRAAVHESIHAQGGVYIAAAKAAGEDIITPISPDLVDAVKKTDLLKSKDAPKFGKQIDQFFQEGILASNQLLAVIEKFKQAAENYDSRTPANFAERTKELKQAAQDYDAAYRKYIVTPEELLARLAEFEAVKDTKRAQLVRDIMAAQRAKDPAKADQLAQELLKDLGRDGQTLLENEGIKINIYAPPVASTPTAPSTAPATTTPPATPPKVTIKPGGSSSFGPANPTPSQPTTPPTMQQPNPPGPSNGSVGFNGSSILQLGTQPALIGSGTITFNPSPSVTGSGTLQLGSLSGIAVSNSDEPETPVNNTGTLTLSGGLVLGEPSAAIGSGTLSLGSSPEATVPSTTTPDTPVFGSGTLVINPTPSFTGSTALILSGTTGVTGMSEPETTQSDSLSGAAGWPILQISNPTEPTTLTLSGVTGPSGATGFSATQATNPTGMTGSITIEPLGPNFINSPAKIEPLGPNFITGPAPIQPLGPNYISGPAPNNTDSSPGMTGTTGWSATQLDSPTGITFPTIILVDNTTGMTGPSDTVEPTPFNQDTPSGVTGSATLLIGSPSVDTVPTTLQPVNFSGTTGPAVIEPLGPNYITGPAPIQPLGPNYISGPAPIQPLGPNYISGPAPNNTDSSPGTTGTTGWSTTQPDSPSIATGSAVIEPLGPNYLTGPAPIQPLGPNYLAGPSGARKTINN